MRPTWPTASLDLPARSFDAGVAFWRGVTGYALAAPRGRHDEFATLDPPEGHGFVRVQRIAAGTGGIHLDLHVADPRAAATAAVRLGATEVVDVGDVVVLRSPGGLALCFVSGHESRRPAPARWPGGRSILDQVCVDIPTAAYDAECAFWSAISGWELRPGVHPETFSYLVRPPDQPLRLLLQRLDEPTGPVRAAHLDLAADDRVAEVRRHRALGARVEQVHELWTVLRDPTGAAYCVTDRDPETGMLG